ncbi:MULTISPECIES: ester cyclase [unclassified Streptomyces]|uniref:Ester cyclase n=1 Tax=Streptomyces millisiae TaxID=3075542 RepID=A0ABU2LZ02_9ACTN|nr:ester cyclase [Streptomyces sp. DSM 44918]MDT0322775.1 ester cyclase [Streptomyces sp. DSM 44918]
MTFVQVIDCRTSRVDELNRLMDTWVASTQGKRTATHSVVGTDRDDSTHVVEIVEFPSYEEAKRNSDLPETGRIFEEMVALCDDVPRFTDLDVVRDEQLNKATARSFFEEISKGNPNALEGLCTPGYVDHDPGNGPEPVGRAEAESIAARYVGAISPTFLIDDQVAEGDMVTTRWTVTGTHDGEFMGLPPTGRPVRITGQTTHRFDHGLIAEAWWNWDQFGLLSQIGMVEL